MPGYLQFGYFDLILVQGAAVDFRSALVAKLLAETSITGIVGNNVLPGMIPETEHLPALVYRIHETDRGKDLAGYNGISYATVDLMSSSFVDSDVIALAKALRNAFDGYAGLMDGVITVYFTQILDEEDDYIEPDDASDRGTFVTTIKCKFKYVEPAPTLT